MGIALKYGYVYVLFLVIVFVFAAACGKKNVKQDVVREPVYTAQTVSEPALAAEDVTALDNEGSLRNKDYAPEAGIYTVYFDFDKSELGEDVRKRLRENAAALKKRATVEIQVAGHCDERGTTEYNLALGCGPPGYLTQDRGRFLAIFDAS